MESVDNNAVLQLVNLTKFYRTSSGPSLVVSDFNLHIHQREFISIIGHSGCGKTTVLSMIAGLTDIDEGYILLDGKEIKQPGTDRGLVFQSPNLLPWMTALDNVLLGVSQVFTDLSLKEQKDRCRYYLNKVGMNKDVNKRSTELSQGMKQRVGIARAFAISPKVLLLDEPFGMLDSFTRVELQDVLLDVWEQEKITAIMVTHDVDEAIYMSDKVVMMTKGPAARIGDVIRVDIERPRDRAQMNNDERYLAIRESIIDFL